MKPITKFILPSLLTTLAVTLTGIIFQATPVWAENSGGDHHDSSTTEGSSTNGGRSCPDNSCNSVIYSGATGVTTITVTEETRDTGVHVPSVCSNAACSSFNYTPSESVITTGDAEIGSTYYLVGMFADSDGVVYIDGQPVQVQKGDLITYIPVVSDGSNGLSSLWSLANSRRATEYGIGMTFNEFVALYHQMLPYLNKEFSLTDLVGFGGLLKKLGIPPEELCKIISCDETPPPPPAKLSCHVGSHVGWTEGKAQVNNLTTETGWTEEVWARPGDTIRFKIDYCWGAQAVAGTLGDPSSPWAINDEGITQTNTDSYYPSKGGGVNIGKQWFQISANKGNNYLFGENEQYIGSSTHTLTKPHNETIGPATENVVPNEYVDSTGDYAFVVYSPSSKPADSNSYVCSIYDFANFTLDGSNGFQIPGATAGGCTASGRTGSLSEAGSKISQTISYNNITAWQQWKHQESGGCYGCTHTEAKEYEISKRVKYQKDADTLIENNPKIKTSPFKSAAEARSGAGNEWGLIEKHANSTKVFGKPGDGDCDESGCAALGWAHKVPKGCRRCIKEHYADQYNEDGTIKCYNCELVCDEWESYDCYKSCVGSSCNSSWGPRISKTAVSYNDPVYNYTTSAANLGTESSTATVNIPYSYRTAVTSAIQEGEVIYLGETVSSFFTASITPRIVTNVRSGEAYATVVPGFIRAVEFVVDAGNNLGSASGSSNAGGTDPCSYFAGLGMISNCNTIWEEHGEGGMLNGEGRYAGKTYTHSEERVVPDIYPVGSKYCVAVGVSTSDSHSQPDVQTVSGMSNISGWRISGLSCRTIAKKPNFQIWNGNFYTKGAVRTSITKKRVGARLGDPIQPTGYFGSWEEYIISAKGNVSGMSSAAGLGYYGEYNKRMLGLQGGTSPDKSFCELSHMTIANSNCASEDKDSGRYYAGNSQIEDSMTTVLERIRSRYLTSTHGIVTLENGATHIYPDQANISTSELHSIAHGALANTQLSGSVIRQTKSAINSEAEQTTSNYASNVLIIHVDGTLTIDTDICTGDGTCGSNSPLILANRNNDIYDNIYSLPQIIIIADAGIVIKNNVTQIDAWLITNGNINTCNGLSYNSNGFSSNACAKQLIVNGPVFANSLTLVRNSGADGGAGTGNAAGGDPITFNLSDDGSIQPGEIFNLRPDVLYWAYSQAQRFSQANVTYSRELAPRY